MKHRNLDTTPMRSIPTGIWPMHATNVSRSNRKENDGLFGSGAAVGTPAVTGDTNEIILTDLDGVIRDLLKGETFAPALKLATALPHLPVSASAKAALA